MIVTCSRLLTFIDDQNWFLLFFLRCALSQMESDRICALFMCSAESTTTNTKLNRNFCFLYKYHLTGCKHEHAYLWIDTNTASHILAHSIGNSLCAMVFGLPHDTNVCLNQPQYCFQLMAFCNACEDRFREFRWKKKIFFLFETNCQQKICNVDICSRRIFKL